jgi:hypothetical protein
MKKSALIYGIILLMAILITSCEREGCTDPLAVNYFKAVVKDDGSCSYSTSRMIGDYTYTYDSAYILDAIVYPEQISYMKVEGTFDESINQFELIVDWPSKTMVVPKDLSPADSRITGKIIDANNFEITYNQGLTGATTDTIYYYNFERFLTQN